MSTRTFQSVPLPAVAELEGGRRAIIEMSGIDAAGPTSELRIFLNNPDAGPSTPQTLEAGYAGTVHVYGLGTVADESIPKSAGEAGCARMPMARYIDATQAIKQASTYGDSASVSIVPVLPGQRTPEEAGVDDKITLDNVIIRTDPEVKERVDGGRP